MKKNRAVVTVHGREYTLLGEEPTDYMQRVAVYVDRRMSEISFSAPLSEDRLMALTALNLADELLKSKDEVAAMRREMANMRREMAALRKKGAEGAEEINGLEWDEDYEAWTFKTRKLENYVISDVELDEKTVTEDKDDTTTDDGKVNPDTGR